MYTLDPGLAGLTKLVGRQTLNPDIVTNSLHHGGHVEAVHIAPEFDVIRDVVIVREGCNLQRGVAGHHQAIRLQVAVSGPHDAVEHGLEEQAVAHPLGDDDVHLVDRKNYLLDLAAQAGDLVGESVGVAVDDGLLDHFAVVHSDDVGSPGLCAEHGEDTRSAAHVQYRLSGKDVLVVVDKVPVPISADGVLEHGLVDI